MQCSADAGCGWGEVCAPHRDTRHQRAERVRPPLPICPSTHCSSMRAQHYYITGLGLWIRSHNRKAVGAPMPDLRRLIELRLNSDVIFDPPLRLYVVPLVEGPLTISVTVRLNPSRSQRRAEGARDELCGRCAGNPCARVCSCGRCTHSLSAQAYWSSAHLRDLKPPSNATPTADHLLTTPASPTASPIIVYLTEPTTWATRTPL